MVGLITYRAVIADTFWLGLIIWLSRSVAGAAGILTVRISKELCHGALFLISIGARWHKEDFLSPSYKNDPRKKGIRVAGVTPYFGTCNACGRKHYDVIPDCYKSHF